MFQHAQLVKSLCALLDVDASHVAGDCTVKGSIHTTLYADLAHAIILSLPSEEGPVLSMIVIQVRNLNLF